MAHGTEYMFCEISIVLLADIFIQLIQQLVAHGIHLLLLEAKFNSGETIYNFSIPNRNFLSSRWNLKCGNFSAIVYPDFLNISQNIYTYTDTHSCEMICLCQ